MSDDIKALHEKLDFLTREVTGITARIRSFDELKEDVKLFSHDAYNEVVNFMAEVDGPLRSEDFVNLIRQMLRNIKNLSNLMTQMESIAELVEDVSPLAKEMFEELMNTFAQLEQANVFRLMQCMMESSRKLFEQYSPEEVEQMVDNHFRLIKLSNRMVSAGNLDKMERVVAEIEKMDSQNREKVSLMKVMKKARSQDVLQTMDAMLNIAAIMSGKNM